MLVAATAGVVTLTIWMPSLASLLCYQLFYVRGGVHLDSNNNCTQFSHYLKYFLYLGMTSIYLVNLEYLFGT